MVIYSLVDMQEVDNAVNDDEGNRSCCLGITGKDRDG